MPKNTLGSGATNAGPLGDAEPLPPGQADELARLQAEIDDLRAQLDDATAPKAAARKGKPSTGTGDAS
jgi:hypothetical protein